MGGVLESHEIDALARNPLLLSAVRKKHPRPLMKFRSSLCVCQRTDCNSDLLNAAAFCSELK